MNLSFGFKFTCKNPEFTPADNNWKIEITDSVGDFLDIKQEYPGYDITGRMEAQVTGENHTTRTEACAKEQEGPAHQLHPAVSPESRPVGFVP